MASIRARKGGKNSVEEKQLAEQKKQTNELQGINDQLSGTGEVILDFNMV
jgi:hypothetical protein